MDVQGDGAVSRRNCLAAAATGAAMLAAGALAGPAVADDRRKERDCRDRDRDKTDPDVLYGHGTVWNRELPGVLGQLQLSFDLRVNLETGTGAGSAQDPVHPDWNNHFTIESVVSERRPGNETRYTMTGHVVRANNPANVGLDVKIIAETVGDTTAIAIRIGDLAFGGAGLVVIAIIAILIGMLLPAIQK
jgi:hypothetical protein